jgi:hypothetical protein
MANATSSGAADVVSRSFSMLFDLQNIDSTENDFKHVDIEIGKLTKTETRMEQENNKVMTILYFYYTTAVIVNR